MWVRIGIAAQILGVCTKTLKRWEQQERGLACQRTVGQHRRYNTTELRQWYTTLHTQAPGVERGSQMTPPDFSLNTETTAHSQTEDRQPPPSDQLVVCYARVSSAKQKEDLQRQRADLEAYCQSHGYIIGASFADIASGLNDQRPGLMRVLDTVAAGGIARVLVTYPDRLSRFGTGIITRVLKQYGVQLEVISATATSTIAADGTFDPYRGLVDDMIALVTSFAGKIHRLRRGKHAAGSQERVTPFNPEIATKRDSVTSS